jgi:hypothetical protein
MADPATASYFADLLWRTLGAEVQVDFSQPWHRPGVARCSGTRGWLPTGWDRDRSRQLCWMPTIADVLSPARTSRRFSRQLISGRSPKVASTVWTTGCCCARTSTPCSTGLSVHRSPVPPTCQPEATRRLQQRRATLRPARTRHRASRTPCRPAQPGVHPVAPRRGIPSLTSFERSCQKIVGPAGSGATGVLAAIGSAGRRAGWSTSRNRWHRVPCSPGWGSGELQLRPVARPSEGPPPRRRAGAAQRKRSGRGRRGEACQPPRLPAGSYARLRDRRCGRTYRWLATVR